MKMLSKQTTNYLFLLPSILLVAVVILYPVGFALFISALNLRMGMPVTKFMGLRQYMEVWSSAEFWHSLERTITWTVSSLILQFTVGMYLALLLREDFAGKNIVRAMLVIPWVIPSFIAVVGWRWMLNDIYGIINYYLMTVGLVSEPVNFFGSPKWAMFTVVMINTWRGYPLIMVMLLAGLTAIPKHLYESAEIDGAGGVKQFLYITLPSLKGIIVVIILLRFLWVFTFFDVIYLSTWGGPVGSTMTLAVKTFLVGFRELNLSRSSVFAISCFLFMMFFSIVFMKLFGAKNR